MRLIPTLVVATALGLSVLVPVVVVLASAVPVVVVAVVPALPPAPVVEVVALSPEQAPSATAPVNKAPIHARMQTSNVQSGESRVGA